MLYGSRSISYLSTTNILIWMILAFQAGLLNIGGFMAGHRIVSHVTGYATYFGYEIGRQEEGNALGMLVVPGFFLLGAMISGYFVDVRLRLNKLPRYFITFGLMFVLTLAIFFFGEVGEFGKFGVPFEEQKNYLLLILLCLVCGIQNGTISTVSRSVIRTTHLTGITTDLGLGLVRLFFLPRKASGDIEEAKLNMVRIGLILAFVAGSASGGIVFTSLGFRGFLVPCLISGGLFGTMLYFQLLKAKN